MREPDFFRGTLSLATTVTDNLNSTLQQRGMDRISGEEGVIKVKSTVVAASGGLLFLTIRVGQRQQITDYAIPAEEAVGAGPTSRIAALVVKGYRGDQIFIQARNPTGGTVVVTFEVALLNIGR